MFSQFALRKPVVLLLGVGLGVGLASFLIRSEPEVQYRERTEYRDRVREKEIIKWQDRIVEVKVKDTKVKIVTKTITVNRPDGTITKVEESTTTDDSRLVHEAETRHDKEVQKEREAETASTQEIVLKQQQTLAKWRVGANIGLNLSAITLEQGIAAPFGSWYYGGAVERRIWGPLWAGGWATSRFDIGLTIAWEF